MNGFPVAIDLLERFCFPLPCALCGTPLLHGETEGLCAECAAGIAIESEPRCRFCGRPLLVEFETCLECRAESVPAYDRMKAILRYGAAGKRLLAAYKFGEHRVLVRFFAEMIVSVLAAPFYDPAKPFPIVPVPPRPGKLFKKGWDQVDYLATALRRSGLPVRRCLRRLKSDSQKALNRQERRSNLKGKIVCLGTPPPAVLLLDDVVTTGATLNACAASLKNAGVETVIALALFYD